MEQIFPDSYRRQYALGCLYMLLIGDGMPDNRSHLLLDQSQEFLLSV